METILTEFEKLELIRQIEKSNLSDEQLKELLDWAETITIGGDILNMLFEGSVEIVDFQEGEPIVSLTYKGEQEQIKQIEREEMSIEEATELAENEVKEFLDSILSLQNEIEEADNEDDKWIQDWEMGLEEDKYNEDEE